MPTLEARLRWYPRRALDLLRQDRRLRRAAKAIPKPLPWDWARPRVMPLLAGPYLGPDRLVTSVADPGCAVIYGVEVKGTYLIVDEPIVARWEVSAAQLAAAGQANLDRRAASLTTGDLRHAILAGRLVRLVDTVPWASSLLLAPDQLVRIFGSQDQLFGAPRRDVLVSFGVDTPAPVAAHIAVDFEANSAYPLLLAPFALIDGELAWDTSVGDGAMDDD